MHVAGIVIDGLPEQRMVAAFCRAHRRAWAAWYTRQDPGADWVPPEDGKPRRVRLHRTEALDRMLQRFREGRAVMPADARHLGGRVRDIRGEYYRELQAPQRTLIQTADGNWDARWDDHGRPDHYAHAEVYCLYAEEAGRRSDSLPIPPGRGGPRSPLAGIRTMEF